MLSKHGNRFEAFCHLSVPCLQEGQRCYTRAYGKLAIITWREWQSVYRRPDSSYGFWSRIQGSLLLKAWSCDMSLICDNLICLRNYPTHFRQINKPDSDGSTDYPKYFYIIQRTETPLYDRTKLEILIKESNRIEARAPISSFSAIFKRAAWGTHIHISTARIRSLKI
jgi:hypothetical protein